ncbi:MAG: dienelactone hydrolase family protein [Bauldia sp.]|nr:dienelactone hydrolase family protein [Bauldia sp.]
MAAAGIDGPRLRPASGRPARQLVVVLHGYGADGNDLLALAEAWRPALPDAAFIVPHAPSVCGTWAGGREWFPLLRIDASTIAAGTAAAAPGLHAFLDAELAALQLRNGALALVGFSQGAMLALDVGVARKPAIAGILAYSGALTRPPRPGEPGRPPVLLHHGASDTVVPAAALGAAKAGLEAAGVPVESHLRPGLGHGIDDVALRLGGAFLVRIFQSVEGG